MIEAKVICDSISPQGKRLANVAPSRKYALAHGVKKYLGKSCAKHPRQRIRWTSNACCTLCNLEVATRWRRNNVDKLMGSRRRWDRNNPVKAMLQRARIRARKAKLRFDLKPEDITIPSVCPVLGIVLRRRAKLDVAPTLDRIKNDLGYVRGNVVVVSHRANRLKGDATPSELGKLARFYAAA